MSVFFITVSQSMGVLTPLLKRIVLSKYVYLTEHFGLNEMATPKIVINEFGAL